MLNKSTFINTIFNSESNKWFDFKSSNLIAYDRIDDIEVWNYQTLIAIVFPSLKIMRLNVNYYSSTTQRNQNKLIQAARRNGYTIFVRGTDKIFEHNDASKKTLALYQ